ncbi:hypothetical protein DSM25558_5120 [Agrobacterium sp. DSM 25558]|uniref:hypothetical protein n=1 Tax=Agrobacterium sp. DSM 25558 TaxID=1907665 RepID=UPI00097264B4|nr:hypothetical protein [Agrobacterium sp. DSM 25558]SCX31101.1 hypothetical protein DSM25558_5120 [Agrobacterium sp. DSM 25558]
MKEIPVIEGVQRPAIHKGRASHHSLNDPYRDSAFHRYVRKASNRTGKAIDRAISIAPFLWVSGIVGLMMLGVSSAKMIARISI